MPSAEPARVAPSHLVPIDQVSGMLAGRIQALVVELLPHGKRDGHEWRCGSLAGERGSSLAVHLGGAKAGVWSDFSTGERGDALDLVAQVLFRGDKRQALSWARRWLGLDAADPAALETQRRQAAAARAANEGDAQARRNAAYRIFLGAQERIAGTPVEYYLAGRGIDLASLERQPRAIRFAPNLWCEERQAHLPAMVAAISGPDGFAACHRTWLEQAGPGDWRKARLEQPKKVMGSYRGCWISLWRGASGKPLKHAPHGEVLDITEGIEDGLSVAMAEPSLRVVAAVSLTNLGTLVFPPAIKVLRIWRQNDTSKDAITAFHRAMDAQLSRGMELLIPPIPSGFKDVNDLLQAAP